MADFVVAANACPQVSKSRLVNALVILDLA